MNHPKPPSSGPAKSLAQDGHRGDFGVKIPRSQKASKEGEPRLSFISKTGKLTIPWPLNVKKLIPVSFSLRSPIIERSRLLKKKKMLLVRVKDLNKKEE